MTFKFEKERLIALSKREEGLIVLTAHVGSWQATLADLPLLEVPVHILQHRTTEDVDRHYFEHQDKGRPFQLVDPSSFLGGMVELTAALLRGEVVCMTGDRIFGPQDQGVPVQFLGGTCQFPMTPYRLAAATGSRIVVLLAHRTGFSSCTMAWADEFVVPDLKRSEPQALVPFAQRFAGVLEKYAQDHPYQVFNFYDMWIDEKVSPKG